MAKRIPLHPIAPASRSADQIIAEIRSLYFRTTKGTILKDFDLAIDLLKTIESPDERQRATVYMDGLAEMRKEFSAAPSRRTSAPPGARARKRSGR